MCTVTQLDDAWELARVMKRAGGKQGNQSWNLVGRPDLGTHLSARIPSVSGGHLVDCRWIPSLVLVKKHRSLS